MPDRCPSSAAHTRCGYLSEREAWAECVGLHRFILHANIVRPLDGGDVAPCRVINQRSPGWPARLTWTSTDPERHPRAPKSRCRRPTGGQDVSTEELRRHPRCSTHWDGRRAHHSPRLSRPCLARPSQQRDSAPRWTPRGQQADAHAAPPREARFPECLPDGAAEPRGARRVHQHRVRDALRRLPDCHRDDVVNQ